MAHCGVWKSSSIHHGSVQLCESDWFVCHRLGRRHQRISTSVMRLASPEYVFRCMRYRMWSRCPQRHEDGWCLYYTIYRRCEDNGINNTLFLAPTEVSVKGRLHMTWRSSIMFDSAYSHDPAEPIPRGGWALGSVSKERLEETRKLIYGSVHHLHYSCTLPVPSPHLSNLISTFCVSYRSLHVPLVSTQSTFHWHSPSPRLNNVNTVGQLGWK